MEVWILYRHLILKVTSWIDSEMDRFCFITQDCLCFLVINCCQKIEICMKVYFEAIKHLYSYLLWKFHVMNPSESSHQLSVAHSLNCMVKYVMVLSSNRWPVSYDWHLSDFLIQMQHGGFSASGDGGMFWLSNWHHTCKWSHVTRWSSSPMSPSKSSKLQYQLLQGKGITSM